MSTDRSTIINVLGIDPGYGGGIAVVSDYSYLGIPMPSATAELWEYISIYKYENPPETGIQSTGGKTGNQSSGGGTSRAERRPKTSRQTIRHDVLAVVEKVGGYVSKDVGKAGMGASMFTFGESYGAILMALTAAKIPYVLVSPLRWQKELGIHKAKGEKQSQWKSRLKGLAQQLFPSTPITLKTADAFLLAEYGRRVYV